MGPVVIVKAILTCPSCPMQWDAWDDNGNYMYLRYRHDRGTVSTPGTANPTGLTVTHLDYPVASFQTIEGEWVTSLEDFCQRAGIVLNLIEPEDRSRWE